MPFSLTISVSFPCCLDTQALAFTGKKIDLSFLIIRCEKKDNSCNSIEGQNFRHQKVCTFFRRKDLGFFSEKKYRVDPKTLGSVG